jgi:TRAP-type uncharacterized transport system substrate-binding protein
MMGSFRLLLSLLVSALWMSFAASAEDPRVSIASGTSEGTYRGVYARDLEARLSDYTVIHRLTSGSGENLEMLADGRANFAFAQADVFAARLAEDPDRFAQVEVLGRLGTECVFVAVRQGGPIDTLDDLASAIDGRPPEIAVGPAQSGANSTWHYLVSLSPELGSAQAHPVGDRVALRFLERGTFDAVVWVTDPSNLEHGMLRAVRESADLVLLPVADDTLTATLPDGTHVYEPGQLQLGRGDSSIPTICTSAVLLGHSGGAPALLDRARRMKGLRRASPKAP